MHFSRTKLFPRNSSPCTFRVHTTVLHAGFSPLDAYDVLSQQLLIVHRHEKPADLWKAEKKKNDFNIERQGGRSRLYTPPINCSVFHKVN